MDEMALSAHLHSVVCQITSWTFAYKKLGSHSYAVCSYQLWKLSHRMKSSTFPCFFFFLFFPKTKKTRKATILFQASSFFSYLPLNLYRRFSLHWSYCHPSEPPNFYDLHYQTSWFYHTQNLGSKRQLVLNFWLKSSFLVHKMITFWR